MRKLLLIVGLAALAVPALAAAQDHGHPGELAQREDRLGRAIHEYLDSGQISQSDAHVDRVALDGIRNREAQLRGDHDGLSEDDRIDVSRQLDTLDARLRQQLGGVY